MLIAKIENEQVYEVGHWSRWFAVEPSSSRLSQMSFKKVSDRAYHDPNTQKLVSCPPYIDGDFVVTVKVESLSTEELKSQKECVLEDIRLERNNRLANTDWEVVRTLEKGSAVGTAMVTYRQALRDIPKEIGDKDPRTWDNWPKLDE